MTTKPRKPPVKSASLSRPTSGGLKTWQADLIACIIIYLAVLTLFHEIALQGKTFAAGDDTEAAASWNTFAVKEAQVREYPFWCPDVFGGFPSFAAGAYSNYEHMGMPYALANRFLSPRYWMDVVTIDGLFFGGTKTEAHSARWILALLLYGGLFTYLLMRKIGFRPLIGLLSGLLMAWNPYMISLATAAHGGKLMTFIYMPLILLLAYNVMRHRRVLDLALLAVGFGWQIAVGGHTQVLFYSFLAVGLFYLTWAVLEWRESKSLIALKPAPMLAAALFLGLAVGSLWYIPLFKYMGFSIRGMAPAFATAGTAAGYSITDATQWSFPPKEILTFIAPSWFGLKSPYYWGEMPFTSSSFYFGIVPLLFAVLAFFGKKDRLFWGLVVISVFSLFLSFGQHFQSFYALFFNYLPFFSKFRTPSLIVLLIVLSSVIWAGYGLRFVLGLDNNEKWKKVFLYGAIGCAALLVLFLITGDSLRGMFGSFSKAGEEARYNQQQIQQLMKMRFEMLHKDLILAFLWLALAAGACYLYVTRKITAQVLLVGMLLFTAIDLWVFTHKFFDPQPAGSNVETLRPNKIVETLQKDHSIFRVMPIGRLLQDNRWAAWEIASLGGYHGAKMRAYQDLLDNVFYNGPNRQMPLNMPFYSAMNCKYLVAEGMLPPEVGLEMVAQDPQAKQVLYRNPAAMDRAYFVNSVEVIPEREPALQRIKQPDFPWDTVAVIDQPLPGPIRASADRRATITEYIPHRVKITATTSVPSFLVLSDALYSPGWEAYDNNQKTTIYKVNTYVRGVYLTSGEHTIEYRYTGKYEKEGIAVATVSHFLVWGLVIGAFLYHRRRRRSAAAE